MSEEITRPAVGAPAADNAADNIGELEFVPLAPCEQIPEGQGKLFVANGHKLAVFRVGDDFYAIANQCPHKKGPLARGYLEGKVVTCPLHGWEIDLETGVVLHDPSMATTCYPLRVEAGQLVAGVPKAAEAPAA